MPDVAFIHPDLGIGGAERVVVDAAIALKSKGHSVKIITAHHDTSHCFPETKNGTLQVEVHGDWLPRQFFGKFHALWAYVRMIFAASVLCWNERPDVILCDQVSACILLFRLFKPRAKVIFYCHFPDKLLTQRATFLKWLYRIPIDYIEEWTTGMAHVVLVNSKFTAGVFREHFPSLGSVKIDVLYPTLNTADFDKPIEPSADEALADIPANRSIVFLSINRYEFKKNIQLAVKSLRRLLELVDPILWDKIHLCIAGGYDSRVKENIDNYNGLKNLVGRYSVDNHITFYRSPPDSVKRRLLEKATAVVYTPDREHFGIVPVEAMYCRRPVIAINSGGPKESVKHEITGFLVDSNEDDFAAAMEKIARNPEMASKMGEAGRQRVIEMFSFETFTERLDAICQKIL